MISYLYWITVVATSVLIGWMLARFLTWKLGATVGLVIFAMGWLGYHFYYEQFFVKHYGGVMSIKVPEGQLHISATWKEDHLWIENYDPKSNTCYFTEYSKSHLLEGKVAIENCNPIIVPTALKP
jgi:hypothetical protein